MILDLTQFFFSLIYRGLKESHKEETIKPCVVLTPNVPASIKTAIKKEYGAKYLDDSDMVFFFTVENPVEPMTSPEQAEGQEGQESEGEQVNEGTKKEDNVETQEDVETKNEIVKLLDRVLYNEDAGNVQLNNVVVDGKTYYFVKVSSRKG